MAGYGVGGGGGVEMALGGPQGLQQQQWQGAPAYPPIAPQQAQQGLLWQQPQQQPLQGPATWSPPEQQLWRQQWQQQQQQPPQQQQQQ